MPSPVLSVSFLLVAGFGLVTWLAPLYETWGGLRTSSANLLTVLLGDSRRLFAEHFYAKADAYFHNGYYPSFFDEASRSRQSGMTAGALAGHERAGQCLDAYGEPKDWIDRFSRNFFPSTHTHLGEEPCAEEHGHKHEQGEECRHETEHKSENQARELLPWLQIAADLDPHRPETYVIASYWLRTCLNQVAEAESFLREGLRANPGNPDLLFELGRICRENRQDHARARNLWELGLARWRELAHAQAKPNHLLLHQFLGNLAKLEEEAGHYDRAIRHLQELKEISPSRDYLQKWIEELQSRPKP